ncbi:MAG: DUF1259 domain-containing protein [Betaproteobacteria bacterium]|nr:DUF1259 domain-containing protein [Betaproteobacteria bacterium]
MNPETDLFTTYLRRSVVAFSFSVTSLVVCPAISYAEEGGLDTARIEQLTDLKGSYDAKEGVFTVRYPRNDLDVNAGGIHITAPFGLTAWAAFTRTGSHVSVMGDMVMLEDQVNPVMSVALESGLQVTALHNHFFWETPRVMFMHIGGMGAEEDLARAVGKVFAKIKETAGGRGEVLRSQIDPAKTTLNPDPIAEILGVKGDLAKGVYKVTVGRTTSMNGHDMGKSMGVNSWAAFAGGDDRAVVAGDIAMHEDELQSVLKTLRANRIDVVAIHNHMTGESPRILFLHYWGIGTSRDLATGVKAAFDLAHD